jgi:hypothetical protein
MMPLLTLPLVAVRALELADTLCWDSLTRGDSGAFFRQAICAELWQFGVCADLLDEGHDRSRRTMVLYGRSHH